MQNDEIGSGIMDKLCRDLKMKIDEIREMVKDNDQDGLMRVASGAIIMCQERQIIEMKNLIGRVTIVIEQTKMQFKSPELKELKDECFKILNNS